MYHWPPTTFKKNDDFLLTVFWWECLWSYVRFSEQHRMWQFHIWWVFKYFLVSVCQCGIHFSKCWLLNKHPLNPLLRTFQSDSYDIAITSMGCLRSAYVFVLAWTEQQSKRNPSQKFIFGDIRLCCRPTSSVCTRTQGKPVLPSPLARSSSLYALCPLPGV